MKITSVYDVAKRNRIESHDPKPGLLWCLSCDRAKVGNGQRCPVCRNISDGQKRLKKAPCMNLEDAT